MSKVNEKEFDEYIKTRIKEEECYDTKPIPDGVVETAIRKAKSDARGKRRLPGLLLSAVILVLSVTASLYSLFQKEEMSLVADESAVVKQPGPKVDVAKTKAELAAQGFAVIREGLPASEDTKSMKMSDIAINSGLKDYMFNSDTVVKGRVLGTRSYIDEDMAFTEVKLLVEYSLAGEAEKGDILTYVSSGGVISRYDFNKIHGIDEKFNITEEEMEAAKKELVAATFMQELVYPDDELYVFSSGSRKLPATGEVVPWMGFRINVTGGNIHEAEVHFELAETAAYKELALMESLTELSNTLERLAMEKAGYSTEAAREAAYESLTDIEEAGVKDWKSAQVLYRSKGAYMKHSRPEQEVIQVQFEGTMPITVYLRGEDLKIYEKMTIVHMVEYSMLKDDLRSGREFEFAYGDSMWGVYHEPEGWVIVRGLDRYSEYYADIEAMFANARIDGKRLEEILGAEETEITVMY
ncbi:hypothetical protein A8F94_09800 [Bacillus sp. FJAT-27225]|uniref:hypothetical protein n=1 Tax=Bacillus sp. FJAT-27225 TaxID=1743144 RepID=UPI00080C317D|nr:hypothetical protein [Bacillus sp. FJAT-27225]OCA88103.1 hypothetical protein A8F94_09800 [Bacillus sp. FJAT-27225]